MTVSLTQAEADQKIQQITDAKNDAVQKLNKIQDAQEQMLQSNWQGNSATTYGKVSQGLQEEFTDIINTLTNVVEKGSEHIRSVANADNS